MKDTRTGQKFEHHIDFEESSNLAKKVQQGDAAAFTKLYDLYFEQVFYSALRYLGNREDAVEVTQDVFVKVFKNIASLRDTKLFHSWINQITHNQSMDMIARKSTRLKYLAEDEHISEEDLPAEENREFIPAKYIEAEEGRAEVLQLVDELNESQKAAVLMYYYDELSIEEIADATNTPAGTIRKRLHDARNFLRKRLSGNTELLGSLMAGGTVPALSQIFQRDAAQQVPFENKEAIKYEIIQKLQAGGAAIGTTGAVAAATKAGDIATKIITVVIAGIVAVGGAALAYDHFTGPDTPEPAKTELATKQETGPSKESTPNVSAEQPAEEPAVQAEETPAGTPVQEEAQDGEQVQQNTPVVLGTPTLYVSNTSLTYPRGNAIPQSQLLRDAGVFAFDTAGTSLTAFAFGHEGIDFHNAGTYSLGISAIDSQGHQAPVRYVAIYIQ